MTTEKSPSLLVYITLPQEDKVMDILEVSEKHDLMTFHIRTLETYAAVCSHSNLELAKAIGQHIDCRQLLECIRTPGMRWELKAAYLKLVMYLHLQHEVQTRLLMRGEFILPLAKCTKSVSPIPNGCQEQRLRVTAARVQSTQRHVAGGELGPVVHSTQHHQLFCQHAVQLCLS